MNNKEKDFLNVDFETGFDSDLWAKDRRNVELEHLSEPPPSVWQAGLDGLQVGFDHTIEKSIFQILRGGFAEFTGSYDEDISPADAKKYLDLDLKSPINLNRALVLAEMKRDRIQNLRDLGRHEGFLNTSAGFIGAMIGNIASPTAWYSGVLAANAISGAANTLSQTARYLKVMGSLGKKLQFASRPLPHTAARHPFMYAVDDLIPFSRAMRQNIDDGVGLVRNFINSPGPKHAVYNGVGNLLEELGVQAMQETQGYRYQLGPMDVGFAIMAPALLSGLGAAAKGGFKGVKTVRNNLFGKASSEPTSKTDLEILRKHFADQDISIREGFERLKSAEGKAWLDKHPEVKAYVDKVANRINRISAHIGAETAAHMSPEQWTILTNALSGDITGLVTGVLGGNVGKFLQDPTSFATYKDLPGSLKTKVQLTSKNINEIKSIRSDFKDELYHRKTRLSETDRIKADNEGLIRVDKETGDMIITVKDGKLSTSAATRRGKQLLTGRNEEFKALVKSGVIAKQKPTASEKAAGIAKYIIPGEGSYIPRYTQLTLKEAEEIYFSDVYDTPKAYSELGDVIAKFKNARYKLGLDEYTVKSAMFEKTGMRLTPRSRGLEIATSDEGIQKAIIHINKFISGEKLTPAGFKSVLDKALKDEVVHLSDQKGWIGGKLDETREYVIPLSSNKLYTPEGTALRNILLRVSEQFRKKVEARIKTVKAFEPKETTLHQAIFRRGFGRSQEQMLHEAGLEVVKFNGAIRDIAIKQTTDGPEQLRDFLDKNTESDIDVDAIINKLKNNRGVEIFDDKIFIPATNASLKVLFGHVKVRDHRARVAKDAELDRLQTSLDNTKTSEGATLLGSLSGKVTPKEKAMKNIELFKESGMYISAKSNQLHIASSKLKDAQKFFGKDIEKQLLDMVKKGLLDPARRGPSGPAPSLPGGSYKGRYFSIPLEDSNYYRYNSAIDAVKKGGDEERAMQEAIERVSEASETLEGYIQGMKVLADEYKAEGFDMRKALGMDEMEAIEVLMKRFPATDVEEVLIAARRTALSMDSKAQTSDLFPQLASKELLNKHIDDVALRKGKAKDEVTLEDALEVSLDVVAKAIDDNKIDLDSPKKQYTANQTKVSSEVNNTNTLKTRIPELAEAVNKSLKEFKACKLGDKI